MPRSRKNRTCVDREVSRRIDALLDRVISDRRLLLPELLGLEDSDGPFHRQEYERGRRPARLKTTRRWAWRFSLARPSRWGTRKNARGGLQRGHDTPRLHRPIVLSSIHLESIVVRRKTVV